MLCTFLRTDRFGIFRGRHTGVFFELIGEIVEGLIAHGFGDLGKIHIAFADEPLGFMNADLRQIGDDGASHLVFVDVAQLGGTDAVLIRQDLQGNPF